jgi:hypothetical protein
MTVPYVRYVSEARQGTRRRSAVMSPLNCIRPIRSSHKHSLYFFIIVIIFLYICPFALLKK